MQDFLEQDVVPLGVWTQAGDSTQEWQWDIHSPGAQSHLLVFRSATPHPMCPHSLDTDVYVLGLLAVQCTLRISSIDCFLAAPDYCV